MAAESYTKTANGVAAFPPAPRSQLASQSNAGGLSGIDEKRWGNGSEDPTNEGITHGNQQQSVHQSSSHEPLDDHPIPPPPPLTRNTTIRSGSKTVLGSPALIQQRQQHSSSSTSIPIHVGSYPLTPIDPLSQQILQRTNTEKSIPSKLRTQTSVEVEPGFSEGGRPHTQEDSLPTTRSESNPVSKPSKEKKKGVSFLSRIIGNKKKDDISESNDDVSELGERRAAGMDAEVFAQPIGYIPRFPPPPKYIRVRAHHKKVKDFNRLFVAQELRGDTEAGRNTAEKNAAINVFESDAAAQEGKAIWVTEFSKDGRYLAAAGQDRKARVWAVIATPEDRQAHEIEEEAINDQPLMRLSAPVFKTQPVREYEGHTGSIVDLSWSKNNFLLSTSLDKTVRLWHVSRDECLCCFKHSDTVTSIEFHPRDDRFFLAGSLDSRLRLWSIPDKSVAFWAAAPDLITAVAFTPDGKYAITGCLNGQCVIYETDGLKTVSQIHVRSARGRNAKGSKITGIDTIFQPAGEESGIVKILITSNDSRIRLYNFRDRTLEAKFRGNENSASQIRASFSDDGRYIICGSEDRRAYIWPVVSNERFPEKRPVESFEAHSSMVTTALMAPIKTKQILGSTGDLLYDLCNPPPITLVSQTGSVASRSVTENAGNDFVTPTPRGPASSNQPKPEESPAYLARTSHPNGNIIVTTDYNGIIKVFRQDCGYQRRHHESWDANSSFSKKFLGRNNSVSTRRSVLSTGKDSVHKSPSERILSWRSSVMGARDNASADNIRTQGSRTRSVSPNRSLRNVSGASKSEASHPSKPSARPPAIAKPIGLSKMTLHHPFSGTTAFTVESGKRDIVTSPKEYEKSGPPQAEHDPLLLEGGQSYMFWNKSHFASQAANRRRSFVANSAEAQPQLSTLTSEQSSDEREAANGLNEKEEEEEEEEEELSCWQCRGTNFRATRMRNREQRLRCVQCGAFAT
ncbi:hypothetical protein PRK78_006589 [Emydomyces testavorans]|uniref:WD repeat protein n=1 Tax=Emydomyces testavorans TaxID=2070801 RepID=A0AAF0DQH6_9EURO|nr:hypothetical protein PRK78_006589 [Emydomyces testavorans]